MPSQISMELLQDSSHAIWGLNARLKSFMEQVNRLQEANHQLEAQIAEWSIRTASGSQNWSKQEQTIKELRSQGQTSAAPHFSSDLHEKDKQKGQCSWNPTKVSEIRHAPDSFRCVRDSCFFFRCPFIGSNMVPCSLVAVNV
ncbi:hypothetical protein GOODEAATRI_012452 [Goodea atripinnis]|uniref:Uncharacterized protein n=1 Tax=Goodea atripinnis TaxID=208336 RepID=A0ABV0PNH1_9TELE